MCSSDCNQVKIGNYYCATSSGQEGGYFVGDCPFNPTFNSTNRMYSEMPRNASQLDEVMCGPYNRRGLLCGECKDGYGPAAYSLDMKCADCSDLWSGYAISLYVFLQFIPTTLIYICLVVFCFKITSGPLLGYVLFSQGSTISITARQHFMYAYMESNLSLSVKILIKSAVTLSQFWCLQFFNTIIPPFCISEKLTSVHVLLLDFIPAVNSFALVIITCILMELYARNYRIVRVLWKPFKIILSKANVTEVNGDCVFRAFASLIFLSSFSVLFVCIRLFDSSGVNKSPGSFSKRVLYVDPTVDWLSQKFISYGLIAAVLFIIISVIPSVILCIYPTRVYQYLSRFLNARKQLAITAFAEALHSCFKDGLNGTRDYRGLAGAPLCVALFVGAVCNALYLVMSYSSSHITAILILMMLVCIVSYLKPCKSPIANISLVFHMTLFGILMLITYLWKYDLSVETYTLELAIAATFLTPHILVVLWAGYTLTKHTLTRFGYQFHGPGCKVALSDMANGVRLCLCRRYRDYQELDEQ